MRALRLFDQTMSYRAQNDETMTKASTPTEERLIKQKIELPSSNLRLATEQSLYDDDVTLNSESRLLILLIVHSLQLLAICLYYKGALCTARVKLTDCSQLRAGGNPLLYYLIASRLNTVQNDQTIYKQ